MFRQAACPYASKRCCTTVAHRSLSFVAQACSAFLFVQDSTTCTTIAVQLAETASHSRMRNELSAGMQVFDVANRSLLRQLKGHSGGVHATRFAPDKLHVLSGSDDATVRAMLCNAASYVESACLSHPALPSQSQFALEQQLCQTALPP